MKSNLLLLVLIGFWICINDGGSQTPVGGEVIQVPPPDPSAIDHTGILQKAAEACVGKTNPVLRFSKGTYYLSSRSALLPQGGLKFEKIKGLTIDGQGAVILMVGKLSPFYFKDCDGIVVKNLTIDSAKPYFAQGKITAGTENSLEIEIDPAFPLPEGRKIEAMMDYDPVTRLPLANMDIFGTAITRTERLDENHLKLEFRKMGNPKQRDHFAKWFPASVGKLVLMRLEVHGHYAIDFVLCRNIVLEKVNIYAAPGMGIHAQECENITSRGVQVRIKPGSGRLMSTTIDCQYYTFCKGSIVIEDGYYEGMGDDGFNVTSKYRQVKKVEGENVFYAALPGPIGWCGSLPVPGEKLTFHRGSTDLSTSTGTWTVKSAVWDAVSKQFRIEVVEPMKSTIKVDDLWYSETYLPKVEIRRCTFRGMRARGILLSTRDVLIENCKIEGSGYSGILLKGGLRHGYEGPPPSNVTIRSCTFEGSGGAAIYGYADGIKVPAGALNKIVIENNIFRETAALASARFKQDNPLRMYWAPAVSLQAASNVSLIGNTFEGYPTAIYLGNVSQAKVDGNHSKSPAAILLEKASTQNVQIGKNEKMEAADAPTGTLPDLEYMNDFR